MNTLINLILELIWNNLSMIVLFLSSYCGTIGYQTQKRIEKNRIKQSSRHPMLLHGHPQFFLCKSRNPRPHFFSKLIFALPSK